ncbi:MAG: YraN family protein [Clostridia bacterium]
MNTKQIGDYGEELALTYLMERGWILRGRNVRFGHKELDLVMQDGETIVFVEVKARSSDGYGTPAEFVNIRKQRNLIQAAQAYLIYEHLTHAFARFDVVEVYLPERRVVHIQGAFST